MKTKMNKPDEEGVPAWQTIYCSLILIMLVLFVMLASYSVADKKKVHDFKGNFSDYRGNAGAVGGKKWIIGHVREEKGPDASWISDALHSLRKKGTEARWAGSVVVEKTKDGLKCQFASDLVFPAGGAVLDKKSYPYLNELIRVARTNNLSVRIEGHTDDAPVRTAAFPSNWELSTARAATVLKYFFGKGKLLPERLAAAGFGQYHPLVPNSTPEGRAQNRRIEIWLVDGSN